MKKILSVLLTVILSLFVVSTTDLLQAEATEDVTIYLHIHQYDGDYTNTGTGVWDGVNWNNWQDVADPTLQDDFGAVIKLVYTAAEINAVSDQIEFKPTRDVNNDDNTLEGGLAANQNYLAPDSVEGKVFADVTALKDGSVTELHLYYVEGAKDFYVVEGQRTDGLFFNVFANPEVAADETIYEGWGMHSWNTGYPDPDWNTNENQYEIEMELYSEVGWIPARLGIIKVMDGNTGNGGFIAHKGDHKSCPQDMFFDTDDLLALNGKAEVVYYEYGACEFAPDYASFINSVATKFEINSGNRLVEGTQIVDPATLEVQMLMPKKPEELLVDRFMVKDENGYIIPIESVTYPVMTFGSYQSDVELRTETHVIVFVQTDLDSTHIALVGNMQGWAPEDNPILTTGTDMNGYAVFEFTTFEAEAQFKFLYDDTDAFNWGDTELIGDNIVVDLSAGGTIEVFFDDNTDTYSVVNATPAVVDPANYTYTSAVTCNAGENLFTLFLDTDLDSTKIGLVGSIQEANPWSPENAILASDVTTEGYVVFETCVTGTSFEYKVLFDGDDNGLVWGDRELVQSNTAVDFGDGTTDGSIAHLINGPITVLGDYSPILSASSTYRLSIYMSGDVDWTKVGIVGQLNDWDITNVVTYKEIDDFGNAIFDIPVTSKTGEYLVVYDANGDGFNWDDKISGDDNLTYDMGEAATLVQYATITGAENTMELTSIGATIDEIVTNTVTLHMPADSFVFDGVYTVSYLDEFLPVITDDASADLFISEYIEGSGNNKAIEIYNPTGAEIDLTPYSIQENYGSGTNTFDLTGTLASGEALVICTDAIDAGTNLEANCDIQLSYPSVSHFNGNDSLQLQKDGVVIDQIGDEATAGGDDFAKDVTLVRNIDVIHGNTVFDMNEWTSYPQDTFDFIGGVTVPSYIMFEAVPVILHNNFVPSDVVAEIGTFAVMPDHIQVQFDEATLPMESLKLLDVNGEEVTMDVYDTTYGIGDYTPVNTCAEGEQQIFVHIKLFDTEVTDLAQLGIVGTINGWDVENSITASGTDSEGNYVFEVCLASDVENGEFKIKFDPDLDGFTWDGAADPEMTPSNVMFAVVDGPHFYVEEGNGALNVSKYHTINLAAGNELDKTSSYTLEFTDESGFVVSIPVDMDSDAPVIQATVKPGVDIVFDSYSEEFKDFDLFDYFDILTFVDTRDGDLGFEIEQAFNPSMVGTQNMYISATDAWGNKAVYAIPVEVVYNDVDAPVITGEDTVTFTAGDEEPDWASYVTINEGTLSIDTSQVDMSVDGTFYVIYTAEDEAGNKSTHTLQVTVEPLPEPEPEPDTGCFGSLNVVSTLILSSIALGGAAVLFVRKR
jgi:hypothetical protein